MKNSSFYIFLFHNCKKKNSNKIYRCENHKQTKDNFSPDDKVQFVIDAVFAIAYGLQVSNRYLCLWYLDIVFKTTD